MSLHPTAYCASFPLFIISCTNTCKKTCAILFKDFRTESSFRQSCQKPRVGLESRIRLKSGKKLHNFKSNVSILP